MPLYSYLTNNITSEKNKLLLIGSGALQIGQAGEFDYSGSQALRSFIDEGFHVIVVNPNIASVQTDPGMNISVYLVPVEPKTIEKIIIEERPIAIVGSFGGQTALNCLLQLEEQGILQKYNVKNLGTSIESLKKTEDRILFSSELHKIKLSGVPSRIAYSVSEAVEAANEIGYPVIFRSAYTLGGFGSEFASSKNELIQLTHKVFSLSNKILIEKSLSGWKEIEYEIMRDHTDNIISICNIENIDPLGIHTGDSIVVAPSQTLSDEDHQQLRKAALNLARHFEIIGQSNIQFALDPHSKNFFVIEMNARLSRSSALASKATGYPIAFIAAKVIAGYNLFELQNPVTKTSCAFFEPAMDYVVVKIPKWNFDKFPEVSSTLNSQMKSVGEVMSIGGNFSEALQKAMRMVTENDLGYILPAIEKLIENNPIIEIPTEKRLFIIFYLLRKNKLSCEEISRFTKIDLWFIKQFELIICIENKFRQISTIENISYENLLLGKKRGFSDAQISFLLNTTEEEIRLKRTSLNIYPIVRTIDTTAAEYPIATANYCYLTYCGSESDSEIIPFANEGIVVLGSGPYRIGSSVEFDWSAVHASQTIRKNNLKSIIINCNPETVSTDYNSSDRLYFEELTLERILDICQFENTQNVIVCFAGQIGNILAESLQKSNLKLLGHSLETIKHAENRNLFSKLLTTKKIAQPQWISISSAEQAEQIISQLEFPVLVRPSYVLSGSLMKVCYNKDSLQKIFLLPEFISPENPIVITEFLENALELELDGVAFNGQTIVQIASEHIEHAGIHSGDSTIVIPPQKLSENKILEVKTISEKIISSLKLNGPFNIQFLYYKEQFYVIECNARSSRSFPFISKVTGVNLATLATQICIGKKQTPFYFNEFSLKHVAIKAAKFSFNRLPGADPLPGIEMKSTGEIGCIGKNFQQALLLALSSIHENIHKKHGVLVIFQDINIENYSKIVHMLQTLYAQIYSVNSCQYIFDNLYKSNTVQFLEENFFEEHEIFQVKKIDLVITLVNNSLPDSNIYKIAYNIRKKSAEFNIPIFTNYNLINEFLTVSLLCYIETSNFFKLETSKSFIRNC